jgi:hypothetical protein
LPFTLSHAAAVLPFARTRLPLAALVAGSVAPDLPYYVPSPVSSRLTHSPSGLLVDMVLGALLLAVHEYVARAPLHGLTGRPVPPRRAWSGAREESRRAALAAVALAVGAATHMAWDSFTQAGGALVRVWPPLSTPVAGPHLVFNVLMYASSAFGLGAVAWWMWRHGRLGRATRDEGSGWNERDGRGGSAERDGVGGTKRGLDVVPGRVRVVVWAGLGLCAAVGVAVGASSPRAAVSGYDLVRAAAVGGLCGSGAGLAAWTTLWWCRLVPRR